VRVHLFRQLSCDLDRLDLGAEGAAENPLDQAFEPGLETPEDTHDRHIPEFGPAAGSDDIVDTF
jgi:hypothetical protein